MTGKTVYSYTVLRYVHDVLTGEFVNVGVVLFAPKTSTLRFKTRTTIGRLKGVFPDIDRRAFVSAMQAVRRGLQRVAKLEGSAGLFTSEGDAASIARKAVPPDDSSLQWSQCGTGLTEDPDKALARLFDRMVARYDVRPRHGRSDEDVWRPVRLKLEEHALVDHLQEKVIGGVVDDIVFKHAWKNGQWHVYEPLSFDLADADGIKSKAREWLGHISAVVGKGSAEAFKPHFIVGAPRDVLLADAFETAKAILMQAPNDPEIFEESQIDDLIAKMEDEMRAHRAFEAAQ